jgi:nitrate reductase NapAB chaperone NapD
MLLIFYEKASDGISEQLKGMMKPLIGEDRIKVYHTISILSKRLARPIDGKVIIVLVAADRNDLLDIYAIRELFGIIRIIIILPDREDESVRMGYQLQPRFLTYMNEELSEVYSVLRKMLKLSGPKQKV